MSLNSFVLGFKEPPKPLVYVPNEKTIRKRNLSKSCGNIGQI